MSENRRYFSRIKLAGEVCQISILGGRYDVQLTDQSIGGACISGLEMVNVIRGLPCELEIQEEHFSGQVLNVFRDEENQLCFGIAWNKKDLPCNRVLLNTYVQNGGEFFVCDFREIKGDKVRVCLSGEELDIPRAWVTSMTEGQREVQLENAKLRNLLGKVYGLPTRPTKQNVLDYEFAISQPRVVNQSDWVAIATAQGT